MLTYTVRTTRRTPSRLKRGPIIRTSQATEVSIGDAEYIVCAEIMDTVKANEEVLITVVDDMGTMITSYSFRAHSDVVGVDVAVGDTRQVLTRGEASFNSETMTKHEVQHALSWPQTVIDYCSGQLSDLARTLRTSIVSQDHRGVRDTLAVLSLYDQLIRDHLSPYEAQ